MVDQWRQRELFEHNMFECIEVHPGGDHPEWLRTDAFREFWRTQSTEFKHYQHAVAYQGRDSTMNERVVKRYVGKPCREVHKGSHADWVISRAEVVGHWEGTENEYKKKRRDSFLVAMGILAGLFAIVIIIGQLLN